MISSVHRVRIGSRWQITIPREIREKLGIRPGQTLWVESAHGGIQIHTEQPADEADNTHERSSEDGSHPHV